MPAEITPIPEGNPSTSLPYLDSDKPYDWAYTDDHGIKQSFCAFSLEVHVLSEQLRKFTNHCQELGRIELLLLAVKNTRKSLKGIRGVVFRNAVALVPGFFEEAHRDPKQFHVPSRFFKETLPPFEELPRVLDELAVSFRQLHDRISEFREFTDEGVNLKSSLSGLQRDIKYRTSCARYYSGTQISSIWRNVQSVFVDRFCTREIQRYIHQFSLELKVSFHELKSAVNKFGTVGVSAISRQQERSSSTLTYILTVSTLFSGVTATTLKMSISIFDQNNALLVTNLLWPMSIIFSAGVALNCLFAIAWNATKLGTRGRTLPLWVILWIDGSQLLFLGIAIVTFSAGLIVCALASNQASDMFPPGHQSICEVPVFEDISGAYRIADEFDILVTHKDQKAFQIWSFDVETPDTGTTAGLSKRSVRIHDEASRDLYRTCMSRRESQSICYQCNEIRYHRRVAKTNWRVFLAVEVSKVVGGRHPLFELAKVEGDTATLAAANSHMVLVKRGKEFRETERGAVGRS